MRRAVAPPRGAQALPVVGGEEEEEEGDPREAVVAQFLYTGSSRALGTVRVRVLEERDVDAVGPLLSEAGLLSEAQGRAWARAAVGAFPEAACLVGEVDGRAVGVVGLSFGLASRQPFTSLVPPDDVAYLSELAVSARVRRAGVATCLMGAAEAFASMMGFSALYLHCRYSDRGAFALYSNRGYTIEANDPALLPRRRALKVKAIDGLWIATDAHQCNGASLAPLARSARGMPTLSASRPAGHVNGDGDSAGVRASIVLDPMTATEDEAPSAPPRARGDLLRGSDLLQAFHEEGEGGEGEGVRSGVEARASAVAHARSKQEANEALILTATFVGVPLLLSALLGLLP